MGNYRDPDLKQRQNTAAEAKKALLKKFQAALVDPAIAERQAARVVLNEARLVRIARRSRKRGPGSEHEGRNQDRQERQSSAGRGHGAR